jgi:hypothetical protein
MSLVDMLGAPVEDPAAPEPAIQHSCRAADYREPEPVPAPRKRNKLVVVLLVVAALGVGVAGGWYGPGLVSSAPAPATTEIAGLPAGIAGFAELYVAQQLSRSTTGDGAEQVSDMWINQAAAIAGRQVDEQSWLVTVAVDSLELVDSVYQPTPLQYFDVLVALVGGRPSAVGLPARVPMTTPADQSSALFSNPVPDDQAVAAVTFINEYLTGGKDLNRYLAAPTAVTPFDPAPYASVVTRPLGANSLGAIRMAVAATKSNGVTHELEYVLTLILDDGVWVVSSITPAAR